LARALSEAKETRKASLQADKQAERTRRKGVKHARKAAFNAPSTHAETSRPVAIDKPPAAHQTTQVATISQKPLEEAAKVAKEVGSRLKPIPEKDPGETGAKEEAKPGAMVQKEEGSPAIVEHKAKTEKVPAGELADKEDAEKVTASGPRDPRIVKIVVQQRSPTVDSFVGRFDQLLDKLSQLVEKLESRNRPEDGSLDEFLALAKTGYQLLHQRGAGGVADQRQLTQLAVRLWTAAELLVSSSEGGRPSYQNNLSMILRSMDGAIIPAGSSVNFLV
jgi:hypothetical protein